MTKTCFKCKKEQPVEDFYRHPQMADGRLGKCKTCTKSDVSCNYRRNFSHYKEYDKQRELTPARKAHKRKAIRKHRSTSPLKYQARTKIGNALRDGKIAKRPCEVCGSSKAQAHHSDYAAPLDVQWLCFEHHRQTHGQLDHIAIS